MAIKKSQIYSTLWESCNALRGTMDASQYKDYVLVMLFWRYVSDKQKDDIPNGCSFYDLVKHKVDGIGEYANRALKGGVQEEDVQQCIDLGIDPQGLAKIFDLDNDITISFVDESLLGKNYDDTVKKLVNAIGREELDFSKTRIGDDDLIGDAYEYLMRQFASQSGKSKGQFYTPGEVSRLMSKLLGIDNDDRKIIEIYDPTCGSGSLLLRAKGEAKSKVVRLYGQESDKATVSMAHMNFIVHGCDTVKPMHGNTIDEPQYYTNDRTLKTFNYVLANPPFSSSNWQGERTKEQDTFGRWGSNSWAGSTMIPMPPATQGDYAFLLHIMKSMNADGKAAVILPHGVLYRGNVEKGETEAVIRRELVKKHIIRGIIGLPGNLFYGTGIPACIILLDNNHLYDSKGIFMINAKDGFKKDGAKNRLREQDIKYILDTWAAYEKGYEDDVPHFAHLATWDEIENKNKYNLNISRYVPSRSREIQQDIHAHINLAGGLPSSDVDEKMSEYWTICNTLKQTLFSTLSEGYYHLNMPVTDVMKETKGDDSFKKQAGLFDLSRQEFTEITRTMMEALEKDGFLPKEFIANISEKLLSIGKADKSLVQAYELYDQLMVYWADEMQDDLYLVKEGGWHLENQPVKPRVMKKNKKEKTIRYEEKTSFAYNEWVCDLLPVEIIINEFFATEDKQVKDLTNQIASLEAQLEEMEDANENNAFALPYFGTTEKITAKKVAILLTGATARKPEPNEIEILQGYMQLTGKGKELAAKQAGYKEAQKHIFKHFEKVNQTILKARIKEIPMYNPAPEKVQMVWLQYLGIEEQRSTLNSELNALKKKLHTEIVRRYQELSDDDVKRLVIERKWIDRINNRLLNEMERATVAMVEDIKSLHKRYEHTLPQVENNVRNKRNLVVDHLRDMGINIEELCKEK